MTELIPLAVNGEFTLYERKGCSTAQWRSLKLVRHPCKASKQNAWWLGWSRSGKRLARNTDAGMLAAHYPTILQWVGATMKRTPPPDRNAEKQRRYRERLKQHQVVAPVPVDEAFINFLIRTGWLAERDSHKRSRIAESISRMIAEAEEHL